MRYGPNLLIECDRCKTKLLVQTCWSMNSFDVTCWSDGQTEGGESFPPLSRCPTCKLFIWVYDVPVLKEVEWESPFFDNRETDDIPWVEPLLLEEFKEALTLELFASRSQEIYLRLQIWRRYNDRTRAGEPLYQQNGDGLYYHNNLVRLDALVGEKEAESPEDEEEYRDEEPRRTLLRAEGYRNRGKFEQCLALLHGLPEDYQGGFAQQLISACNEKQAAVFVVKPEEFSWSG